MSATVSAGQCARTIRNAPARGNVKAKASQEPLLLRVARGEETERTPVWLMRQAGRYMKEFRAYSDVYPFRHRSETPEIAIELSLQPYRNFKTDAVIFFSDILTPLPALGIEFDIIKGKGPRMAEPIRSMEQVKGMKQMDDPLAQLGFIQEILSTIRTEINSETALLGFVGTPWTLAAYAIEGKADKNCQATKTMMFNNPEILHALLENITEALITYVAYQIESGAHAVQLFDSWAHHLSPEQFDEFSLPYAQRVIDGVRKIHPTVPLMFHANGGAGKMVNVSKCDADVLGLDWNTNIAEVRAMMPNRVIQGNVDPMVLFGSQEQIKKAVDKCLSDAGDQHHILNVGHGVVQGTPEDNVKYFVQLARESKSQMTAQPELIAS